MIGEITLMGCRCADDCVRRLASGDVDVNSISHSRYDAAGRRNPVAEVQIAVQRFNYGMSNSPRLPSLAALVSFETACRPQGSAGAAVGESDDRRCLGFTQRIRERSYAVTWRKPRASPESAQI